MQVYDAFKSEREEFVRFLDFLTFPDYDGNHLIFMFDVLAFFDASGNHTQEDSWGRTSPAVAIGGYLASKDQWDCFNIAWLEMLARNNAPYFHAKELTSPRLKSDNPFKEWTDDQVRTFRVDAAKTIADSGLFGIGACVVLKDFEQIMHDIPNSSKFFQSPYYFCAWLCLHHAVQWAKDKKYQGAIEYVFEKGDDHQGEILDAYNKACKDWNDRAYFQFAKGGLTFKPKGLKPLEAADGLAHGMYKELFRKVYQPEQVYTREEFLPFALIPGEYKYNLYDDLVKYLEVYFRDEIKKKAE